MNTEKTKTKLKTLSQRELDVLLILVQEEYKNRGMSKDNSPVPQFTSNASNSSQQMADSLERFFNQAWIHG